MKKALLTFITEEQLGSEIYEAFEDIMDIRKQFVDVSEIKEGRITFEQEVINILNIDGILDTNENVTITIEDLIKDMKKIEIIASRAIRFEKRANNYEFDEEDKKMRALAASFLLFTMIEKKYENIKSLDQITEQVPFSVVQRIIEDSNSTIRVAMEKNGITYAGILHSTKIESNFMGVRKIRIMIETIMVGKNNELVKSYVVRVIPAIPVIKDLSEIGLTVLTDEDIERFTTRGRKTIELLTTNAYKKFSDFGLVRGFFGSLDNKYVNSRIIIDAEMLERENNDLYQTFFNEDGRPKNNLDVEELIWSMQPDIPAYSLNDKIWFITDVDKVQDIQFNDNAFEELKIKQDYKDLLLCMINNEIPSFDPISDKGQGKIFLLNGNPGIGKTLTAEAMAEYLHKPLYFVSVGELGTETEELEQALVKIINLTKKWNAIVLIDEVDVFAQKRNATNLKNNAMTAVFLRMIERFEGLMFMTTNMSSTLDEAFISRATLVLDYKDLTCKVKKQIFEKCLETIKETGITVDLSEKYLDKISTCKVNGRVIKNIMRLAYSLALKDKVLDSDKIDTVLGMYNVSYGEE